MAEVVPIKITVCGFAELSAHCKSRFSHVLSLLDPGTPVPSELRSFPEHRHIELRFHDVIEALPGTRSPAVEHVEQILALGRDLLSSSAADRRLLIHCHAGFSRSPAVLAVLIAQAQPSFGAAAIAREVLRIRPNAWPNLRIVELGDQLLGYHGGAVEAAARIYRKRLHQDPALAELMRANDRMREVEAARRLPTCLAPAT